MKIPEIKSLGLDSKPYSI